MKKVIEIVGDIERHFIAVFDQALKSGGYAIKAAIDAIERSIQLVEEKKPEEKKE